jgi:hypothetical protein
MAKKASTKLTAQERVILFFTATGIGHADVGITADAMKSMAIKGFIVHDRESGAYTLTDSGRATLTAMLEDAGLKAGRPTSIDTWIADLMEKPENKRAESLYELLLRLNLSMSHLEDAHETYARRLGLR